MMSRAGAYQRMSEAPSPSLWESRENICRRTFSSEKTSALPEPAATPNDPFIAGRWIDISHCSPQQLDSWPKEFDGGLEPVGWMTLETACVA
ncbi:MAG: hypothetical protein ACE5FM_10695 [Methyloligellaceae bacterium]